MKRFAFTMLELVFVIIVIGILAVLAMPNFRTNPLQQVTEQVASHIRYTQHLAMVDDKFDPTNAGWFNRRWQLTIAGTSYNIYSDTDQDGALTVGEAAIDPLTRTPLFGINLATEYSVTEITAATIAFDNLGRPYNTNATLYGGLLDDDLDITIVHSTDGNATIRVHPETGYVSVRYN